MEQLLDPLLIVALALNFVALGVSRIRSVINAVALQGVLLGACPLLAHPGLREALCAGHVLQHEVLRGVALMVVIVGLKGVLIPAFLVRAMREANIQHEVWPVVSCMSSLLLGAVGTGLALVFSSTLPLAERHAGQLIVPASFATVWAGFLLLTTRQKAIMQVLGYLLLENGIFLFGLLLLDVMPFLVEVGVLLDLFTGVFIMGIIIHHISRKFDSMSTEHLTELKE
jgi:hydrogenase-4 component E